MKNSPRKNITNAVAPTRSPPLTKEHYQSAEQPGRRPFTVTKKESNQVSKITGLAVTLCSDPTTWYQEPSQTGNKITSKDTYLHDTEEANPSFNVAVLAAQEPRIE